MSIERIKVAFDILADISKEDKIKAIQQALAGDGPIYGGFRDTFTLTEFDTETDELVVNWFGKPTPQSLCGESSELIILPIYSYSSKHVTCLGFAVDFKVVLDVEIQDIITTYDHRDVKDKPKDNFFDHILSDLQVHALIDSGYIITGKLGHQKPEDDFKYFAPIWLEGTHPIPNSEEQVKFRQVKLVECDSEGYWLGNEDEHPFTYPLGSVCVARATTVKNKGFKRAVEEPEEVLLETCDEVSSSEDKAK